MPTSEIGRAVAQLLSYEVERPSPFRDSEMELEPVLILIGKIPRIAYFRVEGE
jgi:hypothetical protein